MVHYGPNHFQCIKISEEIYSQITLFARSLEKVQKKRKIMRLYFHLGSYTRAKLEWILLFNISNQMLTNDYLHCLSCLTLPCRNINHQQYFLKSSFWEQIQFKLFFDNCQIWQCFLKLNYIKNHIKERVTISGNRMQFVYNYITDYKCSVSSFSNLNFTQQIAF